MSKKRLLTGLQPSGALHIGNYFGALKPFRDSYEEYDSHLMVVDLHALTTVRDGALLRQNIIDVIKDYVAIGIDPTKAIIFKQSDVPEHAELAWILECMVTVPFLMQAHSYKDKIAKGLEPNAGLFNYPMLMAADILLYDTEVVPVGEDQRQHIEYTREAANKFNLAYGKRNPILGNLDENKIGDLMNFGPEIEEFFKMPEEMILKAVGVVPGTDGQKMSKSYKNTIPLFGTREKIEKAVMSIVTDSSGERPEHVYAIHSLLKSESELAPLYEEHKGKYKNLKDALVEDLDAFIAPMRERRASITDSDVKEILKDGAERAHERASKKMEEVRQKIGTSL